MATKVSTEAINGVDRVVTHAHAQSSRALGSRLGDLADGRQGLLCVKCETRSVGKSPAEAVPMCVGGGPFSVSDMLSFASGLSRLGLTAEQVAGVLKSFGDGGDCVDSAAKFEDAESVESSSVKSRSTVRKENYKRDGEIMANVPGYCYLRLFRYSKRSVVRNILGPYPNLLTITAQDPAWFATADWHALKVTGAGTSYHLSYEGMGRSFYAAMASTLKVYGRVFPPGIMVDGVEPVGEPLPITAVFGGVPVFQRAPDSVEAQVEDETARETRSLRERILESLRQSHWSDEGERPVRAVHVMGDDQRASVRTELWHQVMARVRGQRHGDITVIQGESDVDDSDFDDDMPELEEPGHAPNVSELAEADAALRPCVVEGRLDAFPFLYEWPLPVTSAGAYHVVVFDEEVYVRSARGPVEGEEPVRAVIFPGHQGFSEAPVVRFTPVGRSPVYMLHGLVTPDDFGELRSAAERTPWLHDLVGGV